MYRAPLNNYGCLCLNEEEEEAHRFQLPCHLFPASFHTLFLQVKWALHMDRKGKKKWKQEFKNKLKGQKKRKEKKKTRWIHEEV